MAYDDTPLRVEAAGNSLRLAREAGAREERKAVVSWLHAVADRMQHLPGFPSVLADLCENIEAGEHRKEGA